MSKKRKSKIRKKWKLKPAILKSFLAGFIIYHLAVIFIIPYHTSIIHEKISPYLFPYSNMLLLTSSWDFFSPNPTYYHYFEYEVIYSRNKIDTFRWPPSRKESKRIFINHNRLIYHTRFFMMSGKEAVRQYFISYLCRLHPSAKQIAVKAIVEDRPHLKKAQTFATDFFSPDNKKNMKEWFVVSSNCSHKDKSRQINQQE